MHATTLILNHANYSKVMNLVFYIKCTKHAAAQCHEKLTEQLVVMSEYEFVWLRKIFASCLKLARQYVHSSFDLPRKTSSNAILLPRPFKPFPPTRLVYIFLAERFRQPVFDKYFRRHVHMRSTSSKNFLLSKTRESAFSTFIYMSWW